MSLASIIVAIISAAVIVAPFIGARRIAKYERRQGPWADYTHVNLFNGLGVLAFFWVGLTAFALIAKIEGWQ